jgi:amino-acid N-acetyltransferase
MTMSLVIERAYETDRQAIVDLLERNRLPLDGLEQHWASALVARQAGRVIGSAALELYADGALLRSVAVDPDLQGTGVGRQLTAAAIEVARTTARPAIYLLTTTAERFFPKFGFERITRADVPASVQTSVEFTSACPSTAVVMRKQL